MVVGLHVSCGGSTEKGRWTLETEEAELIGLGTRFGARAHLDKTVLGSLRGQPRTLRHLSFVMEASMYIRTALKAHDHPPALSKASYDVTDARSFRRLPTQDQECMRMDETLYGISEKVKNFAVIYLVDITKVPDFTKVRPFQPGKPLFELGRTAC